jgi:hypothetical protein
MSYSISISGHGATSEKVKEVFSTAVKDLAEANAESGGGEPGGSASGSGSAGDSFSISSIDVLHPVAATAPEADDPIANDTEG